jgi:hypothetical protein
MDRVIPVLALIAALAVVGGIFYRFVRKMNKVDDAKLWPGADATIQSGELEVVAHMRYGSITLPCFAFSYTAKGEYYSGRFALLARGDQADVLLKKLVDQKLRVNYDPEQPSTWHIPHELIEGCQVEQKISAELVKLYPDD